MAFLKLLFLNTVVFVKVRCSRYTFLHIFDYNENLKPVHQQLYQILKLLQTKINKFQSSSSMWENTTVFINKDNTQDKTTIKSYYSKQKTPGK